MTVNSWKKIHKHFCIRHNLTQGDGRDFQNGGLLLAKVSPSSFELSYSHISHKNIVLEVEMQLSTLFIL